MNISEFDKVTAEFLSTCSDKDNERWDSFYEQARGVIHDLRKHLFSDALEKAERYEQYLKLKAEFE